MENQTEVKVRYYISRCGGWLYVKVTITGFYECMAGAVDIEKFLRTLKSLGKKQEVLSADR